MANRQKKTRKMEGVHWGSDENRSAEIRKFLRRAPQFESLARTPADNVLTDSQKKFIDDFVTEVRRRAGDADDAS